MGQVELLHGFGDVARLFCVERARFSFADGAKAAMPRANIAAEHEGCGAVRPAFENVWAACFLANRVEVQPLDQLQDVALVRRIAQTNLQPLRLWLTWPRIVADYCKFARQGFSPRVQCKLTTAGHSNIAIVICWKRSSDLLGPRASRPPRAAGAQVFWTLLSLNHVFRASRSLRAGRPRSQQITRPGPKSHEL